MELKLGNIKLPDGFMDIIYNPKIFPNGELHDCKKNGANCQVYAYEILRLNGKNVPDLRSSEMWVDNKFSFEVHNFEELDLIFFNNSFESYGAHVGLYIGDNKVLHNTNKTGGVEIWNLEQFENYEDYQFILGGKRFI